MGRKSSAEERACESCGVVFLVGGRGNRKRSQRLCSMRCQQLSRRRKCGSEPKPLSVAEAAYIAGLVDGEGSVMLVTRAGKSSGAYLRVAVSNTHRGVLEWLTKVSGIGAIYEVDNAKYGRSKKQGYSWRTHGELADGFLRQLLPYLIIKKLQADLALAFQERLGDAALRADKDWQHDWMERMKAMNARSTRPIQTTYVATFPSGG